MATDGKQSRGHGQKIGRKAQTLIANLLTEPTHAAAAQKTGIGLTTLHRWLNRPDFQREYRVARRRVVDHVVARLSALGSKAIAALARALDCGERGPELRAALGVLDNLRALATNGEIEERLAEIERELLEEQK
jgi:hypothetical protein